MDTHLEPKCCFFCPWTNDANCSFVKAFCCAGRRLIVGGGVIGVATAYALTKARPDLDGLLLEAGTLGAINGRLKDAGGNLQRETYAAHMKTPGCSESCTAQIIPQSCKQKL